MFKPKDLAHDMHDALTRVEPRVPAFIRGEISRAVQGSERALEHMVEEIRSAATQRAPAPRDPNAQDAEPPIAPPPERDPAYAEFGPLLLRAPSLTAQAIETVFEQAAQHVLATADAAMQAATEMMTEAKAHAEALRAHGKIRAHAIATTAQIAKDTAGLFRSERAKIEAFRQELAGAKVEA